VRVYTAVLSIVVHLAAIGAVIVVPLVATDVLPEPRRAVEFIEIRPIDIVPPPPPVRRAQPETRQVSPDAAPIEAPIGVEPEPDVATPPLLDPGFPTVEGVPILGDAADATPLLPPPVKAPPVRVGGTISRPERVHYVAPEYPALARAARREGTVILEAVLDIDGSVREARVLRSIPLLDAAALEAVQQWTFTPTLLNGEPVPVVLTVTVVFSLR
jgi:periplasmic protein TonB